MQIFSTMDGKLGGNKNSHRLFRSAVSERRYKQKAPISPQRREHLLRINRPCSHRGSSDPDKEPYVTQVLRANTPRSSPGATNPNHEQQSSRECPQLCLQHARQRRSAGGTGTCMYTHADVCIYVHQNKKPAGKNHIREQKVPQEASVEPILGNTELEGERPPARRDRSLLTADANPARPSADEGRGAEGNRAAHRLRRGHSLAASGDRASRAPTAPLRPSGPGRARHCGALPPSRPVPSHPVGSLTGAGGVAQVVVGGAGPRVVAQLPAAQAERAAGRRFFQSSVQGSAPRAGARGAGRRRTRSRAPHRHRGGTALRRRQHRGRHFPPRSAAPPLSAAPFARRRAGAGKPADGSESACARLDRGRAPWQGARTRVRRVSLPVPYPAAG